MKLSKTPPDPKGLTSTDDHDRPTGPGDVARNRIVGARVAEARQAMGLPVAYLANILGVTRQTVYAYESGSLTIPPDRLAKLASVLDQPLGFFESAAVEWTFDPRALHFRDTKDRDQRARAATRLKWLQEYFGFLLSSVEVPALSLPELDPPGDPTSISSGFIEAAAASVRAHWKLGLEPVPNVIRAMERHGIVVGFVALNIDDLDGVSCWSERYGRPFVLLNSDKASAARSRFDAAHELGHIVLHRNVPTELIELRRPRDDATTSARPPLSPIYKLMEQQAHDFARAFLMPAETWGREGVPVSLTRYKNLKARWLVSISAMLFRARDLGLADKERLTMLRRQLTNAGWKKWEPYDDLVPQERPQMFRQATELLVEHGVEVAEVFPRRLHDLESLAGVDPERLTAPAKLVTLN